MKNQFRWDPLRYLAVVLVIVGIVTGFERNVWWFHTYNAVSVGSCGCTHYNLS